MVGVDRRENVAEVVAWLIRETATNDALTRATCDQLQLRG